MSEGIVWEMLKALAAMLPGHHQQALKRWYFRRLASRHAFRSDEPEFELLDSWIRPGDWVIDVGANVGHYTARMSQLVGSAGRVIALEPIPATFELLASNASWFAYGNVTLLNAAASDTAGVAYVVVPKLTSGLDNNYMAHLSDTPTEQSVFRIAIDSLNIPARVTVVKVDVEGHEAQTLAGMRALLVRDKPILVVEGSSPAVAHFLAPLGYVQERRHASPNSVYHVPPQTPFN